jgi:EpsD family peptidyl-prolyl cis-trans isomerase
MRKDRKTFNMLKLLLLMLYVALAVGCGKKDEAAKTQVAARVNAEEITVHQINAILARSPGITAENSERAKREILDRLIEQYLAKQQAVEKKLDRSPAVVQAIETARTEILARSYLEQVNRALPAPTEDEVRKYYSANPELFADRKIFVLEEVSVPSANGFADALREQVSKARALDDIIAWLKSRNIGFAVNRGVRGAEQIPLDLLPKIQKIEQGGIQLFEVPGGHFQIIRVVATKPAPVDQTAATPRIQQFLFNQRAIEASAKELKRMKAGATIEYVGEFDAKSAESESAAKARAQAQAEQEAQAAAKAKATADAQARAEELSKARAAAAAKARQDAEEKTRDKASKTVEVPQKALERGIGGLK